MFWKCWLCQACAEHPVYAVLLFCNQNGHIIMSRKPQEKTTLDVFLKDLYVANEDILEDNPVMKNDVVTLSNRWVEGESGEGRDKGAEGLQELWWQQ